MNLLIFGASGETGRELVKQALAQGHEVTEFVRDSAKLKDMQHPNLKLVEGDVADSTAVEQAIQGQDAVLSALGSRTLKKNPKLVEGMRYIVQAMEKSGVKRLVYESALGVGDSRKRINFVFRYIIIPLVLRNAIADHEEKEAAIKQSQLDWVIVRPAGLTNGRHTGEYRHGESIQYGARISCADVADFMLKQVTDNTYLHQIPGMSY
jgi:putative NADH-flavin reductase